MKRHPGHGPSTAFRELTIKQWVKALQHKVNARSKPTLFVVGVDAMLITYVRKNAHLAVLEKVLRVGNIAGPRYTNAPQRGMWCLRNNK